MNRRRDTRTLDLFSDWTPPAVVDRPDERVLRARTLRERIALAVAEVLEASDKPREQIAEEMTDYLGGETVSKAMLDNYASQAKDEHTISFARMVGCSQRTVSRLQSTPRPLGKGKHSRGKVDPRQIDIEDLLK